MAPHPPKKGAVFRVNLEVDILSLRGVCVCVSSFLFVGAIRIERFNGGAHSRTGSNEIREEYSLFRLCDNSRTMNRRVRAAGMVLVRQVTRVFQSSRTGRPKKNAQRNRKYISISTLGAGEEGSILTCGNNMEIKKNLFYFYQVICTKSQFSCRFQTNQLRVLVHNDQNHYLYLVEG